MKILWQYVTCLCIFSKGKFFSNICSMVLLGLTEGSTILLLISLLGIVGILSVDKIMMPFMSLIETIVVLNIPKTWTLLLVLIFYMLSIIVQGYLQRYQTVINADIQFGFIRYLREESYKLLLYTKWDVFTKQNKTDIINVLTTELIRVMQGTLLFFTMISNIIIAAIYIIIACFFSAKLTAVIVFSGLALTISLRVVVKLTPRMGKELTDFNRKMSLHIIEYLHGIKEIKCNGKEKMQIQDFHSLNEVYEKKYVATAILTAKTDFLYKIGVGLVLSLFFYISIALKCSPEELLMTVLIFSRLIPRFSNFQIQLQNILIMLPAFQTVIELQKSLLSSQEAIIKKELVQKIKLQQYIEFKNVFYRYTIDDSNYVVNNACFKIPAYSMTAFVGHSGAGKSTLADLLIGLLTPEHGEILIDNIVLNEEIISGWQQSIGYVSQDAFLFNESIRDNLLRYCPDASEAELLTALNLAACSDFLKKNLDGLDTIVGDSGIRLSGGERQRIVLARALLGKPSILILDEATSALDTENERKIQTAIESLKGKITIVVIAHRLSTICAADNIIVIDDGSIVETGSFDQLSTNTDSRFYFFLCGDSNHS